MDLLVLGQDSPAYAMWFGNGDGTLRPFGPIYSKNATGCGAHGDFNLDGREDVVYCAAGRKLTVMLGNGDGTFSDSSVSIQGVPRGVAIADFNGDRKPDLAIATSIGASVLFGLGDGTFGSEVLLPGQYQANSLAAADFNGDGHTDLAVSWVSGVVLYLGNGLGSFPTQRKTQLGPGATQILSADFNHDGIPDLAFNCVTALDGVLLGRGDGSFQSPAFYGGGPGFGLAAGDVDGDGIIDLAFSNGTASFGISVFHGVGDGSFIRLASLVAGQNTTAVALADLRNSGTLDLIASDHFPGAINVLRNSGNGRFQNLVQVKNIGSVSGFRQLDFNHDGNMDVVASTASGLVVLQGTGVATQPFLVVQKYPFGRCSDVETADFTRRGSNQPRGAHRSWRHHLLSHRFSRIPE